MDALRRIARAHYEAAPPQLQARADSFFNKLDYDGNGWVSLPEFMAFMCQHGDQRMNNPNFFALLDRDRNGVLDFWEVMTLYYIVKSRRPFCDCCDRFITATYYSCVACFDNPRRPFHLCLDCYRSGEYVHSHNGRVQFLDNYTMLELKRNSSSGTRSPSMQPGNSNAMVRSQSSPAQRGLQPQSRSFNQYPNAIVPAARTSGWNHALRALEVGLSIGNIATTLCSIL